MATDSGGSDGTPRLPEDPQSSIEPTRSAHHVEGQPISLTKWKTVAPGTADDEVISTAPAGAAAYRLLRVIGRGGMGEVWEAMQASLERVVAVKKLKPADEEAGESLHRERVGDFQREALISARLEHPNIVPVHDQGVDHDGTPLLAMKLVRGRPWNEILREDFRHLGEVELLQKNLPILVDMAQAVAFAHSRSIVHRDLKPSQVMVGEFGEVMLMDWGLAIYVGEQRVSTDESRATTSLPSIETASNPSGTPVLMAPEQTESNADNIGPWTDIYLLGGTLYYLLTGCYPHESANSAEAFARAAIGIVEPPSVRSPYRRIPEELEALAMSCLAPAREDRLRSATLFIERIRDWINGSSRRREAEAIVSEVAAVPAAAHASYEACSAALARLARARELWPDTPQLASLEQGLLERHASLALSADDLTLARLLAQRLAANSGGRDGLLGAVERRGAELRRRERARARLRLAVFGLTLLIAFGGVYFTQALREQRDLARDRALEAERQRSLALRRAREVEEQRQLSMDRTRLTQELVGFMLDDLSGQLDRNIPRDDAIANAIVDNVRERIAAIDISRDSPDARALHAAFLNHVGDSMLRLSYFDDSLAYQQSSLDLRKGLLEPGAPELLWSQISLSHTLRVMGRTREAAALLDEAEALAASRPPDAAMLARILTHRARLHEATGELRAGLDAALRALPHAVAGHGERSIQAAECHSLISDLHGWLDQLDEAEAAAGRALDIVSEIRGPEHHETAIVKNNLAYIHQIQGDYERAEREYREVLAIKEARLGSMHPSTASTVNNIGTIHLHQGRFDEAIPYIERALGIWRANFGEGHHLVTTGNNNLASALYYLGRIEDAAALLEPIASSILAKEDFVSEDTAILNTLAMCCIQLENYDRAMELLERTLEMTARIHGENSPTYSERLSNLADVLDELGRDVEALDYRRRDAEVHTNTYGPTHRETITARRRHALALCELGRGDEGGVILAELNVIAAGDPTFPPLDRCFLAQAIAECHRVSGDDAQAIAAWEDAYALAKLIPTEGSRHVWIGAARLCRALADEAWRRPPGERAALWQRAAEVGAAHYAEWLAEEALPGAQCAYAEALWGTGELELARKVLQVVIEMNYRDETLERLCAELQVELPEVPEGGYVDKIVQP